MTNPTPEEKCSHEWKQSDRAVVFTYCLKCGVVSSKPSDRNPCSPSPEAKNMNKCLCGHLHHHSLPCPIHWNPSPEARVDWEKEKETLDLILKQYSFDGMITRINFKNQMMGLIQAAFEKGREER